MMKDLIEYVKNWNAISGVKPSNEPLFVNLFIQYLNGLDNPDDLQFDGSGSYFGKQVTVQKDSNYYGSRYLGFEIAYDAHAIRVYSSSHEGFWVPEYLSMTDKDERFNEVKDALKKMMMTLFGLNEL